MWELGFYLGVAGMALQLIAIVVALIHWRRLSFGQRWIAWMLVIVMINQLIGQYIGFFLLENNYPYFHVYILLEFSFLALFFRMRLRQFLPPNAWVGLAVAFAAFWVINITLLQSFWGYPTISRTTESALIIIMAILYFIGVLRQLDEEHPQRTFSFWVCAGLLVYHAANILINGFGDLILRESDSMAWGAVWSVHGVLNILLYLALGIAYFYPDRSAAAGKL